jgi:potassium-dependent mechanosensitive channel
MHLRLKHNIAFLILFFLLSSATILNAQDSIQSSSKKIQIRESVNNIDTTATNLIERMEIYSGLLNKANNLLSEGLDTTSISEKIPEYEQLLQLTQLALSNQSNNLNMRALNSTRVMLRQVKKELKVWQDRLFEYNHALADISQKIALIDSNILLSYSEANELKLAYSDQFVDINQRSQSTRLFIQRVLFSSSSLQGKITRLYILSGELISECERNIKSFAQRAFLKEEPYLHQISENQYTYSFSEVLKKTADRALNLLDYYLSNTWRTRIWNIVITLLLWLILKSLLHSANANKLNKIVILRRSILFSCILITLTLAPFIYVSPPAIYVEILWFLMACIILYLNWSRWTLQIRSYWFGVLGLMLLLSIDSLLLFSSYLERYGLATINLLSIALGLLIIRQIKYSVVKGEATFRYVVYFFIILNFLSIISNAFGRFTLAKLFSSTSDTSLALAFSLALIKEIVLESLYVLIESNRSSSWLITKIEFEDIKKRLNPILKIIAITLWLMTVAWGMNIYEFLAGRLEEFMNRDFYIGSFHFSLMNIAIFLTILWVSNLSAELLSVVFRDETADFASNRKNKAGSWIIVVKLLIYILGFLLAVSAAGIPIDKIAIVIGALGVGIGFGLQNIVNNLVSGIILAFEKPITIGDVIEVGNRLGTVKEIGIRSSKINTYEGAEIIVPNGELISSQLINWTRNNSYKRVEIIVGISYNADIMKAKTVATDIMQNISGILHYPQPSVLVHELADSSVNLRLLFWAEHFDEWAKLKSEVTQELLKQFKTNNIDIPFPQRDIHITQERQSS